jgi:hypothetical protein
VSLFTRATLWETLKTAEVTKEEPQVKQKAVAREIPVDASEYIAEKPVACGWTSAYFWIKVFLIF